MTPDEINRAIAERLGIHAVCDKNSNLWSLMDGRFWVYGTHNGGLDEEHCWRVNCPDYSGDLNAIHEALKSLTEVELFRYADEVCDLAYDGHHDTDIQTMLMLSAKELAECYVRAIGKWRDK